MPVFTENVPKDPYNDPLDLSSLLNKLPAADRALVEGRLSLQTMAIGLIRHRLFRNVKKAARSEREFRIGEGTFDFEAQEDFRPAEPELRDIRPELQSDPDMQQVLEPSSF